MPSAQQKDVAADNEASGENIYLGKRQSGLRNRQIIKYICFPQFDILSISVMHPIS
jgi:hypothetical protein